MPELLLIEKCSPTLAGLKTGNMFSCYCGDVEELFNEINDLNTKLSPKGVVIVPIKFWNSRVLIYVYRPDKLQKDFESEDIREILAGKRYESDKASECLNTLISRLNDSNEFPHEIGVFLGYPAEDVRGFIENNAQKEKYVGHWKVYGDVESSKATFEKFNKCTRIYRDYYSRGTSIEKLVV